MGQPAVLKGGWMHSIDKPNGKVIRIQNNTFERMKLNSVRNGGEVESVSEIIDRLLDNWERNH
jgi:hypothetical protein